MRYRSQLVRHLVLPGALLAAGACGSGDLTLPGKVAPPADLLPVSGDSQSARVGDQVPVPLVVRLVDEQGNAVPGGAVSWVIGDGGGSVSPATAETDSAGLASTHLTVGLSPGANTANAVVSGVDIVTFTASATAAGGGGGDGDGRGGHGHGGKAED
jgi:hypothetical protein